MFSLKKIRVIFNSYYNKLIKNPNHLIFKIKNIFFKLTN